MRRVSAFTLSLIILDIVIAGFMIRGVLRQEDPVEVILTYIITFDLEEVKGLEPPTYEVKVLVNSEYEDLLAHLIGGEARGQSDYMQLAVGSVVLNRMKSDKFPNTMQEVIFQSGQYQCTWDGNFYKDPTEQSRKNARYLLVHGSIIPEEVIWQANFKQGKHVYKKIDGMYFCY